VTFEFENVPSAAVEAAANIRGLTFASGLNA
jgi:hypothetical protein